MDYFESRDDCESKTSEKNELSPIQKLYEGATVFITGATGFVGRALMEKLLRTCNVAQIYILVRHKKGADPQQRLSALFDDTFFELLRLQMPEELKKVAIVCGDCSLPDIGLSDVDKAKLAEVNIIFHAAATLYLDQHLKVAYNINVVATRFLLEFAKTLPRLQGFIYVSTAYTHTYKCVIEEKLYEMGFDEHDLDQICNQLDDTQIGALTPKLIGKWGNTYTLTKAYTENLVAKYKGIFPIGVVRPSIVVSTVTEPLKGWINNIYGSSGVVIGTGLGVLRVWCTGIDTIGDMIPVDVVANATLAAGWEVVTKATDERIYNFASSSIRPITWGYLREINQYNAKEENLYSTKAIGIPLLYMTKNRILFWLMTVWYHVIPAFFFDIFLRMTGKQAMLMKTYIKIYVANLLLTPMSSDRDILISTDNFKHMWNNLHPQDKQLFNFDLWKINWDEFWFLALKGLRLYIANDPMDTLPEGSRRYFWLRLQRNIFQSIMWFTIMYCIYSYCI